MSTETTEAQKEQVLQQQASESNESSSASTQPKLEGEALNEALAKQIEYYFSKQNLLTDRYLVSQMNADFYVPIKTIANFKMIKSLTTDIDLVVNIMKQCKAVEVDETAALVRPYLQPTKNTIILREVAPNTTEQEVRDLFNNEACGKVQEIRSEIGDYWYIVFENDQDALKSLEFISGKTFKDQPIKARLKFENTFRNILASTVMAATTPAVPAVPYSYPPGSYATYPPGQRQRDASYGRGYDKRGGHRGTGNRRRDYSGKEGQKEGTRPEGQRRYTKGGSLKNEPQQQRRRKGSEGASSAPPLGPANFPPLSPASDKQFGYEGIFQKYTKQDIVDIIKGVSDTSKPEDMPADCKAVAQTANLDLEVLKPFPKSAEVIKKPVETVWKANASVPAAVITPPKSPQPKQATSPQPPTKQDTQPKQGPTNTNTNNKASNPKPKSKGNRSRSSSKNHEKPADQPTNTSTTTAAAPAANGPAEPTQASSTAPATTPAAPTQAESTQ
mmetsp:Transcript_20628/g.28962  ORF Transcript_20628/g.28962 Transcript_20628/m.28962 type:complete len:502 (-) Transcript_20628:278-1783(-)